MPRVTVIIATFNWSSVLETSIPSVLAQTFTDFELLVVGDGCVDNSEVVVEAFAARDGRVRWVNLPENMGQAAWPNNEGIRLARGEFIAYLGHDDLWLPHHLEVAVAALDAGADLTYSIADSVGPDGHHFPTPKTPAYTPGMWIAPTTVVHRRAALDTAGGWPDFRTLPWDVDPEADLWRRVFAAGHRVVLVPRLTAVKLAASDRKDVYRTRPNHEQRAWGERIRTEPDLEPRLLAEMLLALAARPDPPSPRRSVAARAREQLRGLRMWVRAGGPFRAAPPAGPRGHEIQRRRVYKGLAPLPETPPPASTLA